MFIFKLVLLISTTSHAFLNFVGEQAKKAVEVGVYVDAASELALEVAPDKDLENGARDIQKRANALRSEADSARYLSSTSQQILKGPDWSSQRLETNIRNTTNYIRRLKRLIVKAVALGTDGTTALNTTETNVALNEVQKNQQAMIIQNEDRKLMELEREREETRQWSQFSREQRQIRGTSVSGKL